MPCVPSLLLSSQSGMYHILRCMQIVQTCEHLPQYRCSSAREGNAWSETRRCLGSKAGAGPDTEAVLGLGRAVLGPKAETTSAVITEMDHHESLLLNHRVSTGRLTWLPGQPMEVLPLLRPYVDVVEDGQLGQAVHEEASVSGGESQWVPLEHQDAEVLQSGQLGDQPQQVCEAVKAQVKGDKVWPKERTQGRG